MLWSDKIKEVYLYDFDKNGLDHALNMADIYYM